MNDLMKSTFLGPWVSRDKKPRSQDVFLTLTHWMEAAKYPPHIGKARDFVLFSPSAKEATKYSRLHVDECRGDWNLIRHNVLVSGLAYLAIQRPELELYTLPAASLKESLKVMDLHDRFLDTCVQRFDEWRKGPKVAFIGANAAPEEFVGLKLSKLVATLPTWTLMTTCCHRSPWKVHDWAVSHHVPVAYQGKTSDRLSRGLIAQVISAADHVVVFEAKGDRKHDQHIQMVKSEKKKLSLELYDPQKYSLPSLDL